MEDKLPGEDAAGDKRKAQATGPLKLVSRNLHLILAFPPSPFSSVLGKFAASNTILFAPPTSDRPECPKNP